MARGKNQRSREALKLSVTNEVIEALREENDSLKAEIDRKNLELQQAKTKAVANAQGLAYERTEQLRKEAHAYAEELHKEYQDRTQRVVDRLEKYFYKLGFIPARYGSSEDLNEFSGILEELGTTYGNFLNQAVSKGGNQINREGRRSNAKALRRKNALFEESASKGLTY